MKTLSFVSFAAAGFLLLSTLSSAANAGPSMQLATGTWTNGKNENYQDTAFHSISSRTEGNTGAGGQPIPPYVVSANASGIAGGGVIKASADSSYTTGPLAASSTSFVQWSDQFQINSNSFATGTAIQIHYSFLLDAALSLDFTQLSGFGNGDASLGWTEWRFNHYANSTSVNFGERIDVMDNGSFVTSQQGNHQALPQGGRINLVANTAVGMPTHIYMGLLAQTFIGNGRAVSSGNAVADLGNSLYWGGIDRVTLADGTAIDFSASSSSGIDYANSFIPTADVPEPNTPALFALAMLGFALIRHKRSRND